MNRYTVVFMLFLTLLFHIEVPLAHAKELQRAKAFVSKVKGLGLLIGAIQTPNGYASISRKTGKGYAGNMIFLEGNPDTFVIRKTSVSGEKILEKEFLIGPDIRHIPSYIRYRYVNLTGFAQTADGYVFVGRHEYYGNYDYLSSGHAFVFKLTTDGLYEWSKSYNDRTTFEFVSSKPDGGFVVIGRQYGPTRILLVNFASNGDILWEKTFTNLLMNEYYSQRVSDGIILASRSFSSSGDVKILKINDSGNIVWKNRINIKNFQISLLGSSPGDNGVVIAGNLGADSLGISKQLMLTHLDANGKVTWTETYSLSVGGTASTLLQTSDGGYVISGKTSKGGGDGMLIKINAKRDVVFKRRFGGPGDQKVHSLFEKEGGYFLVGSSSSADMLIMSLDTNGIAPRCSLSNKLQITKVASPAVTTTKLEIGSKQYSLRLNSDRFGMNIADSQKPVVNMCQ